jgi:hypothetical protein
MTEVERALSFRRCDSCSGLNRCGLEGANEPTIKHRAKVGAPACWSCWEGQAVVSHNIP